MREELYFFENSSEVLLVLNVLMIGMGKGH